MSLISSLFNPFKKKQDEIVAPVNPAWPQSSTTAPKYPLTSTQSTSTNPLLLGIQSSYIPNTQTQQKQVPSQPTGSASSNFINQLGNISAEQEQFLRQRAADEEAMQQRLAQNKIDRLNAQIPTMQQAFDRFKGDTEASITDAEGRAVVQKQNVEDEWGRNQRLLAQSRLEAEGRNRNRYAGLNTIDSFGVGSYGMAQENMESDFLRSTNENIRLKAQQKYEVDQELNAFVRQAKTLVYNEQLKLNDAISAIQSDISLTQDQRDYAINQAWSEAQAGVLEIKNYLAELKYQQALAQEEFQYTYAAEMAKAQGGQAEQSQTNAEMVGLIDQILSYDTKPITGFMQIGAAIPGTQAQGTKALYDRLQSMLSLQGRQQLKGSGAISDYEMKILEKAASSLSRSMSDDQFRVTLRQLQADLAGAQGINQQIGLQSFIVP